MEEKTNIDYEKMYKASLQTATQWIKDGCTDKEKICLECVFPELRENEDERIRKELIGYHKHMAEMFVNDESCRHPVWLAWLEKQKERGSLTKEEEYILHRIIEYLEDEACPSEWIGLLHDIYCLPYEKHKEQKPADDKAFEKWLDDWYQGSKEAGGDIVMSEAEFKNWSRGIRNMYQQKPAWSEEDEKMRDSILAELANHICYNKPLDGMPSGTGWTSYKYQQEIDWLKSLRPQPSWKPSEEQLKELNFARLGRTPNVVHEHLDSLYNDLLKLKQQ